MARDFPTAFAQSEPLAAPALPHSTCGPSKWAAWRAGRAAGPSTKESSAPSSTPPDGSSSPDRRTGSRSGIRMSRTTMTHR